MSTNPAGTYILSAGSHERIQVTLNCFGFVVECDDWEQLALPYSAEVAKREPWRGDKAEFFNGRVANAQFFQTARKLY